MKISLSFQAVPFASGLQYFGRTRFHGAPAMNIFSGSAHKVSLRTYCTSGGSKQQEKYFLRQGHVTYLMRNGKSRNSSTLHSTWRAKAQNKALAIHRVKDAILPKGFPHTLAEGFGKYYLWAIASVTCNAFSATISTQALLQGFFAQSTAVTWMLKDIFPQFLSTCFMGVISSFETRSRYWFLMSIMLLQACTLLEFVVAFLTPPEYLLLCGILVAVGKSFSVLVMGVARASFHQNFAKQQNLSDITKCVSASTLLAYTLTSSIGLLFVFYVKDPWYHATALVVSSFLGVTTAFKVTESVNIRSLNGLTIGIVARSFIQTNYVSVPTPTELTKVVGFRCVDKAGEELDRACKIHIGPNLDSVTFDSFFTEFYNVFVEVLCRGAIVCISSNAEIIVLVLQNCSFRDLLFAVVYAEYLRFAYVREMTVSRAGCIAHSHVNSLVKCLDVEAVYEDIRSLTDQAQQDLWSMRINHLFRALEQSSWQTATHCIDQPAMRLRRVNVAAL